MLSGLLPTFFVTYGFMKVGSLRNMDVKEQLIELITPLLEENGYELVKLEISGRRKGCLVRLFVDREAGVRLEDCVFLSHGISHTLDMDADDILPDYVLEVSSPGVNRPLVKESDYHRFQGRRIKIHLREEILKNKVWEGVLADFVNGIVILGTNRGDVEIPYENIRKAKLNPSWDELVNKAIPVGK